jgi:hypothetical protein
MILNWMVNIPRVLSVHNFCKYNFHLLHLFPHIVWKFVLSDIYKLSFYSACKLQNLSIGELTHLNWRNEIVIMRQRWKIRHTKSHKHIPSWQNTNMVPCSRVTNNHTHWQNCSGLPTWHTLVTFHWKGFTHNVGTSFAASVQLTITYECSKKKHPCETKTK